MAFTDLRLQLFRASSVNLGHVRDDQIPSSHGGTPYLRSLVEAHIQARPIAIMDVHNSSKSLKGGT